MLMFCDWLFWTPSLTLDSWAPYRVVRFSFFSFLSRFSFWRHQKAFDVTDTTPGKFSVPRKGHGRNICGLQSFLSPIVFIYVERSFADVQRHFTNKQTNKKVTPQEKMWSVGFYHNRFLAHKWLVFFFGSVKLAGRWKNNATDQSWIK